MKRAIVASVFLLMAAAPAGAWSLDEINAAIDSTNFIVDRGCSGTLISVPQRLILTNHHCIDGKVSSSEREIVTNDGTVKKIRVRKYEDVSVEQKGYEGFVRVRTDSYVAEIVAENQHRDLAALRIKGKIPHTYASPLLPDGGTVVRGQKVYTVGNPLGEDGTLVEGIVSSVSRTFEVPWANNEKIPFYQISSGIAGGNSGGALYDENGFLIGVPAAGYRSATFIGFAIPVTIVKAFLRESCLASAFDESADDAACREKKVAAARKDD